MMTQNRLKELLHYDPETGVFTWKWCDNRPKHINGRAAGKKAGSLFKGPIHYWRIRVDGRQHMAHRLAWLYVHGEVPVNDVDHINGDGLDNRIKNLRSVTRAINNRNAARRKENKSGIPGVHWDNRKRKWIAQMNVDGKRKQLTSTKDFFEAVCVRKSSELYLGYHVNHGR